MKIVISGGLGYVGGRLSKYFTEQGHKVIALSRQAGDLASIRFPATMQVIRPDAVMANKTAVGGADAFIHLAAMSEIDCIKYPLKAIEVNVSQTVEWLDLAKAAGIPRLVYFSTAHVYGKPLEGYFDENSVTRPVHPYAITHKCAEDDVLAYSEEKAMNNTVVRLTNAFGGPAFPTADRWTLLVNDLCRSAVMSGKMTLTSDGLQERDFVCLEDVCSATLHIIKSSETHSCQIYNLGSGHSVSVWDMALEVKYIAEEVLNKPVELIRKTPSGMETGKALTISIEKLLTTGFKLKDGIEDEIRSTLDYFRAYHDR